MERFGRIVSWLRLIALAGIIPTSACPQETSVWIIQGSTLEHLTFGIGFKSGVEVSANTRVLRVDPCEKRDLKLEGAMWVVASGIQSPVYPTRVEYGSPPAGFESVAGPHTLLPGCYHVTISGTGSSVFTVGADGTVTESRK
jgi:hypothetical protein